MISAKISDKNLRKSAGKKDTSFLPADFQRFFSEIYADFLFTEKTLHSKLFTPKFYLILSADFTNISSLRIKRLAIMLANIATTDATKPAP